MMEACHFVTSCVLVDVVWTDYARSNDVVNDDDGDVVNDDDGNCRRYDLSLTVGELA
ncbi:unnamed protein product [Haemonchus placei]|uniref:Secreted protein n=1 Tax=Haemonchus placei TaxID=6290 RepID=A0A0N4VWE6_HAEPC|nr:unnamed protein product [Haemonchus placei]